MDGVGTEIYFARLGLDLFIIILGHTRMTLDGLVSSIVSSSFKEGRKITTRVKKNRKTVKYLQIWLNRIPEICAKSCSGHRPKQLAYGSGRGFKILILQLNACCK